MTIYLWHLTAMVLVIALSDALGGLGLRIAPGSRDVVDLATGVDRGARLGALSARRGHGTLRAPEGAHGAGAGTRAARDRRIDGLRGPRSARARRHRGERAVRAAPGGALAALRRSRLDRGVPTARNASWKSPLKQLDGATFLSSSGRPRTGGSIIIPKLRSAKSISAISARCITSIASHSQGRSGGTSASGRNSSSSASAPQLSEAQEAGGRRQQRVAQRTRVGPAGCPARAPAPCHRARRG